MLNVIKKVFRDEEGQGLVEYALIIALIAIAVMAVLPGLASKISGTFNKVANTLPN